MKLEVRDKNNTLFFTFELVRFEVKIFPGFRGTFMISLSWIFQQFPVGRAPQKNELFSPGASKDVTTSARLVSE